MKPFNKPLLFFVCFLLFSLVQESFAQAQKSSQKIIILHSYPEGNWTQGINSALKKALSYSNNHRFKIQSIETHMEHILRLPPEKQAFKKVKLIEKIKALKPDLLVACDDEIANFLAASLAALKKKTFFTGINQEVIDLKWISEFKKHNLFIALERYKVEESLKLLKSLKVPSGSVSILSSRNTSSQLVSKNIAKEIKSLPSEQSPYTLRKSYQLQFWDEWKSALKEIHQKDKAVWILVPYDVRDENGAEVSIQRISNWLKTHLSIPSIGIIGISTKMGLLAGLPVRAKDLGRDLGEKILKSFENKDTSKTKKIWIAPYSSREINIKAAQKLGLEAEALLKQGFHPIKNESTHLIR